MDPRNPLGRLDRLSRDPQVAELTFRFRHAAGGELERILEVSTTDGRTRTLRMAERQSYMDLMDRLNALLAAPPRRERR